MHFSRIRSLYVLIAMLFTIPVTLFANDQASSSNQIKTLTLHPPILTSTNQDIRYEKLPHHIDPPGENVFIFSPKQLAWTAYDKYGYEVAHGVGNGGADFCDEINEPCRTPIGHFKITRKGSSKCKSSQFPVGVGGSPMPYCMFFKNGCAIHGSPYVSPNNTSHGCIRVLTPAAKWLYKHFLKHGTTVIVLPYE